MSCPCAKRIYVFTVPTDRPLGSDEKDFSAVEVSIFLPNGEQSSDKVNVDIFATGRLGSLSGGLLHLADARPVLQKEEVHALALESVDQRLSSKRTGTVVQRGTQICAFRALGSSGFPAEGIYSPAG